MQGLSFAVLLVLAFCAAGVVYPFRPFGTRIAALVCGVSVFLLFAWAVHSFDLLPRPAPPTLRGSVAEAPVIVAQAQPPAPQPRKGGKVDLGYTPQTLVVPSDTRANYTVLDVMRSPIGRKIVTQRDGPSGRSFTMRECTCPVGRYRVLGEGDTEQRARTRRQPEDDLAKLFTDGAGNGPISFYVCRYACTVKVASR